MKLIIGLAILVALCLWIAKPNIAFKPFKISFDEGYFAVGIFLIITGICNISYSYYSKGYIEGVNDLGKSMIEEIKKMKDEDWNNNPDSRQSTGVSE